MSDRREDLESRIMRRILAGAQELEDELARGERTYPDQETVIQELRAFGEGRWVEYIRSRPDRPHGEPLH